MSKKALTFHLIIFIAAALVIGLQINSGNPNTNTNNLVITNQKLDANNISTWFRTNGSFNYDPFNGNNPGFEWPKGSQKFARFAAGLWLGAKVGNDTLVAIAEYAFEYLNGYTDNNGIPQGKDDPQYRIYRLTYGVNDLDRQQWPNALLGNSNQGAPVYFDNQTNTWKPLDFGHQTLFYRYTDSYPESHTVNCGSTAPLKADIMKIDFSLNVTGLQDVAFSQFTIINRGNATWNNAYMTIWSDDDLGNAIDDKVGCDTIRNLGYTYNATNNDGMYGTAPPAVGFMMLRGALTYTANNNDTVYICRNRTRIALVGYKDLKMSVFNWYANTSDPITGNPSVFREAIRYMSGFRKNGQVLVHPLGYVTKYIYSGDPVTSTGWIQQGAGDDQRFLMSTGPINMAPGDTQVVVVAQLIARGTSNLNSITELRNLSNVVKNYYNSCYTTPAIGIEPVSNEVPRDFKLYQNYPNPFNPVTHFGFRIANFGFVQLVIYNALGKEIANLVNEKLKPGTYEVEWNAENYPSGVYFYKLIADNYSETKKMVLVR